MWLVLAAACFLVAPLAFAIGRIGAPRPPDRSIEHALRSSEVRAPETRGAAAGPDDFANIRIENLCDVGFDQAYQLLRSAPREALTTWSRRLEALPAGARRTAAVKTFFKTLAQIDARTAVDLALALDRHDPRWAAIGSVSNAVPVAELPEVARMFTALNEKVSVNDLIGTWSRSDPAAAAEFLAAYPGDAENEDVASLMMNWAALDPAAAANWLAHAEPKRRVPETYASFYAGWVEHDRAAAFADLAARAGDETFLKAIETVAQNLFTESPDAARAFILALPAGAGRRAAAGQITGYFSRVYLGSDPLKLKADEVSKWLLTLPDDVWHEEIGQVISRWRRDDGAAVEAWLAQTPFAVRDRVLASYCRAFDWDEPSTGFGAGFAISDPHLRRETFRRIFADMTEEAREALLEKIELSPAHAREITSVLERL